MKTIEISISTPLYTLKVASELTGISVYSIRQYIDKGLLIPYRTDTNRHRFSKVDIARLKCLQKYFNMGLNATGIKAMLALVPCWKIRPCSSEDQAVCDAFTSISAPCWEASVKGPECKNVDCRDCPVYKLPEQCTDLKAYLKLLDG